MTTPELVEKVEVEGLVPIKIVLLEAVVLELLVKLVKMVVQKIQALEVMLMAIPNLSH